ncbi:response regulator [Leucobacter alluvii]|uniref:Response regulator n=1 Tax=Leucobacter alluvii TaxID=340321 RepID=A0ABN3B5L4_9MICO
MSAEDIRVMLVDDQELIRTGFKLVLLGEPGIDVIAEAADGAAALEQLEALGTNGCDLVLMDVRMPGMNGVDATAEIVRRFPDVRVVVLTTFDLDEYATGAIQAGASGFLLKDARPTELIDAIRRVAAGDAAMAPSVTRRLLDQLRTGGGAGLGAGETADLPARDTALEALTDRELDVLRLIAEGKNNAEISAELYLSESTVKTHVGRVLAKLQLRDRVHAVIFAKQHGL